MCEICFDRFPIEKLHKTEDGIPENVCQYCAEAEFPKSNKEVKPLKFVSESSDPGDETEKTDEDSEPTGEPTAE